MFMTDCGLKSALRALIKNLISHLYFLISISVPTICTGIGLYFTTPSTHKWKRGRGIVEDKLQNNVLETILNKNYFKFTIATGWSIEPCPYILQPLLGGNQWTLTRHSNCTYTSHFFGWGSQTFGHVINKSSNYCLPRITGWNKAVFRWEWEKLLPATLI